MANDLQRVGLIFKADGTVDFNKSLKEVNASIEENRSAFNLAKSAWDDSTKSIDKLKDTQEYLAKQTKDYIDKVKMLEGELEELESREKKQTELLEKKKEQLQAAVNTTESYKKKCSDLKTELAQLENAEVRNEDAIKNKQAELEKAEKSFVDYSSKVEKLEKDLERLNKSESNQQAAIRKKQSQINQTKTTLNNYKNSLDDVQKKLKSGTDYVKKFGEGVEKAGEQAKKAADKMSGVSTAATGMIAAAAATVPATEEYRKVMASLEVSSELAGYSAEQTEESYKKLHGVLGDTQTTATATANLQAIGLEQDKLNVLIESTIGAWAKYGDSIPIDGLAEAINETIKTGQVTGNLADVLNWGTKEGETFGVMLKENIAFTELSSEKLKKMTESQRAEYEAKKAQYEATEAYNQSVLDATVAEDMFNIALSNATTEAERVDLVMKMLAEQGLTEAGKKWQENNSAIVDMNNATAELEEQTAELAELMAPIVAQVTELVAGLLEQFNNLSPSMQNTIAKTVLMVAAAAPMISIIGSLITGIGGTITKVNQITKLVSGSGITIKGVLSSVGTGAKSLFAVLNAHPVIKIITLVIGAVVLLYNKCEWFREGVNKIFGGIWEFIKGVAKKIADVFDFKWELPKIKLPHFKITGSFSLNPPSIPKLSVSWYAKGGILNSPTIFGASGNNL